MRRHFLILCVALLAALGLAACGGSSSPHSQKSQLVKTLTAPGGQRSYKVKLPNGQVVIQAHDPQLAEPSSKAQLPRAATGVSTVEQYDSVTISTIPSFAHYVAGYVNGLFRNYFQMKGRWPVVIGISVFRSGGADCLDMEPGNPTPDAAGPWAKWQFTQGNTRPCEYSMLSWMPAIRSNLTSSGVSVCQNATQGHCVRLWDANWTYVAHLDAGYPCTQYTDHKFGKNLDSSRCAMWFYHQSVPPKPKPKPKPNYNENFVGGFQRGFTVHWDRRHHIKVPAPTFTVTDHLAWQTGYNSGWKAARRK